MIQITAVDFRNRFLEEIRRTGTLESLATSDSWTPIAINAAKHVCQQAGLSIGNELYLDVMGYEQRVPGIDYDWDLRVAFEHENIPGLWHDELCKLCHVVADLRVLVGYFRSRESIRERLQERIDLMGTRVTRVPESQWLFIFGPADSKRHPSPWVAFTLDADRHLVSLVEDVPLIPHSEFSVRASRINTSNPDE